MKVHDVFGIKPVLSEYSYIDRGNLDRTFAKLLQRQQTHIAIRGASKSGKSWLRQRVLQNPVVVQCRLQYTTADIYRDALARLDIKLEQEQAVASEWSGKVSAAGEAGIRPIAKAQGGGEVAYARQSTLKEKIVGKDASDLEFIATLIRDSGRTLVIEDFQYLLEAEQRKFAFDMKTLWDYRTFVVVVGVWIGENLLVTLNPDLSDRVEEISISWSDAELCQVLDKGCRMLGLRMRADVSSLLAEISYGSVGLLQKLALRLIDEELGIEDGMEAGAEIEIDRVDKVADAAMQIAEQLNQPYQTFARRVSDGIRKRRNATGIYAHAMAAIMEASDAALTSGISARSIYAIAHGRQARIQLPNLRAVLAKFPELQVDEDGRGLVLAYDSQNELISVVDRQLLLYRRYATVKWPWEDIIAEVGDREEGYVVADAER